MSNEITSTHEMADQEHDCYGEPQPVETDMVATKEAENKGIEFHVSMRSHTMSDMESLIVDAAARQLLGSRDGQIRKLIEDRAVALIIEKANDKLASVSAEIIDMPITPTFGEKKPVTMREFIGLTGQAYLTENVDASTGERKKADAWSGATTVPRIAQIVQKAMDAKFKKEIEASTNATVREVQAAIKASHDALLAAEKARFLDALSKATEK